MIESGSIAGSGGDGESGLLGLIDEGGGAIIMQGGAELTFDGVEPIQWQRLTARAGSALTIKDRS